MNYGKILCLALVLFQAIPCKAQYVPLLNKAHVWKAEEKHTRDGGFFITLLFLKLIIGKKPYALTKIPLAFLGIAVSWQA